MKIKRPNMTTIYSVNKILANQAGKKNTENKGMFRDIIKGISSTPFTVIISVVVGFWLNHFLQSAKPAIEDVFIDKYHYYGKLDDSVMELLNNNPELVAVIKDNIIRNEDVKNQFECTGWLDDGFISNSYCYEKIIQTLKTILTNIRADSASCKKNIAIIHRWKTGQEMPELVTSPAIDNEKILFPLSNNQPNNAVSYLISLLKNLKEQRILYTTVYQSVNERYKDHNDNRYLSGECDIYLGVTNKGGTDVLIDKNGSYLQFEGEKLFLTHDDHVLLKPHNYESVKLYVDSVKNKQAITNKWKQSIKKTIQMPYKIYLSVEGNLCETSDTIRYNY